MLSLTLCWLEALPSGTAGTPGAAWADGLDAPAPPFLPGHWGRVQWWHCQPCSGMEPGKCTELSPGIERDQAREVKKEGRREVRQQASSTKLLCKQKVHGAEPRNLKGLSKQSQERMKKGTEAAAKQHQAPLQPGENGASGQEEEKPRDSSLSPRQPMNCLAGNGGTGWTLHCSLGMCGSPLRNCRNSWCRLGRWIGRPSPSVPARPLGPCPVVALPALQWDGAWKVHRAEPRD
ncbi:uncharacterized protein LOC115307636 isoform X3 [Manacus vitellinus]|uniref:uncharacterized protein LOC115307636 isoform X3 n=1 Tax=Manacus vitellinus TaxID=328815 RepID=UPI00115C712E|nr:uncharacterized protein LOC115307636 isoform X3 [Manacus vitellinus]